MAVTGCQLQNVTAALEPVPETYRTSLAEFLARADTFRRADTARYATSPKRSSAAAKNGSARPRRRRLAGNPELRGSTSWSWAEAAPPKTTGY